MLAFITKLVAQIAMIRWLFKLGGLALLLPIAAMLKGIRDSARVMATAPLRSRCKRRKMRDKAIVERPLP